MTTEIILEPIIDDNANVSDTAEPPPADDEAEPPPEPIVEAIEEVQSRGFVVDQRARQHRKLPQKPKQCPRLKSCNVK